jgi:hypothetical protein
MPHFQPLFVIFRPFFEELTLVVCKNQGAEMPFSSPRTSTRGEKGLCLAVVCQVWNTH